MDADGLGVVLVIHRDRRSPEAGCERGAQGIAVRAMSKRCDAVSRLKPDYRNEKKKKEF